MQKNQKGFVGVDMAVTIIAIVTFSTLIISLMYNNFWENLKLKKEALAMVYITETFENIGKANYDEVQQENITNFLPNEAKEYYTATAKVELNDNESEKIIKKVTLTLSYKVGNKTYNVTMERLKAKE